MNNTTLTHGDLTKLLPTTETANVNYENLENKVISPICKDMIKLVLNLA